MPGTTERTTSVERGPARLGHYRLLETVGAGGMGVVFRAWDEHLERQVAVKVLPPGTLADDRARARFRDEARALSRLDHPNIATAHDFDTVDGRDFLVMEFVAGPALDEIARGAPVPEKRVLEWGIQLADGLAAAHAHGVIHRDLKPANLKLTPDGRLKILDFGLARLRRQEQEPDAGETATRTAAVAGTLPYMAPEQLRDGPLDGRTDVYAAGAVMYELATGRRLHGTLEGPPLIAAILDEDPTPARALRPSISSGLERVLRRAVQRAPSARYPGAAELGADLRRVAEGRSPVAAPPRRTRVRWAVGGACVVLAGAAALVAFDVGGLRERLLAGAPRITSIAVLPLENLSGDPGQEYFADGMTESLITDLGKAGALRIVARPSVMRFKGSELPLAEIAGRLNVDALVVGAVTVREGRVAVTAQLIDTAADRQLWSERYERELRDVLRLQGEIAFAIAQRVSAAATSGESALFLTSRTVNPAAYERYLGARFRLARFTERDTLEARDALEAALALDPEFAEAHAALSYAYFLIGQPMGLMPAGEAMRRSRAAASRAVELDDRLAEAHTMLGFIQQIHDYDWAAAEASHRRALSLNPSYAYGHSAYAYLLSWLGRHDEAIALADRAVMLDPLSSIVRAHRAENLVDARRYDEAIAACRAILEVDPAFERAHVVLKFAYEGLGRFEDAVAETEHLSSIGPHERPSLRRAFEEGGARGYWRWHMRRRAPDGPGFVGYATAARFAAAAGETSLALDWAEKAYEAHDGELAGIRVDALYDGLRDEPRFRALLRRMRFP
ncbi:MAG TPA: protein kinase [Candidatus Polarisedimenticolaceae bacterium]